MGQIALRDYDDRWPARYALQAARVTGALGDRAVRIEHVGSTAVPDLPAKPIIDIALEVHDSADERAYAPELDAVGFTLRIREPDWFEHRLFKGEHGRVNLHVFSAGCSETDRMVRFRDWLRANAADRALYAQTKRELAVRSWENVQQYADAKTEVVGAIMARALAAPAPALAPVTARGHWGTRQNIKGLLERCTSCAAWRAGARQAERRLRRQSSRRPRR